MSTRPTIPERYAKRWNDFRGNSSAPPADPSRVAGRMRVEDEGSAVSDAGTWDFRGNMVRALANPATGATDVLIDIAIPTRPETSSPPVTAIHLTAEGGILSIALRWTDSRNAEVFVLYRSEVQGGPYTAVFEGLTLGYDDADVAVGITYYYVVQAENRYGLGPVSNEASAEADSGMGELEVALLANGNAETGNISGWTQVIGTTWTVRGLPALPAAYEGDWFFFAGISTSAELAQDVDVSAYAAEIDAGTQEFHVGGFLRSFEQAPSDAARLVVEFRDAGGVALESFDTGETHHFAWTEESNRRFAPVGTRSIYMRLISVRYEGSNNDGYFDAMYVNAVELTQAEPGEWSHIVYPPIENRLEHAALDGLRWKRAGHTAAGKRVAGFGGDGAAREVRLTRGGVGNAAVETEGTGRVGYASMPAMLEYQVIGAELLGFGEGW